ncbi:hypothetical protein C0995_004559 [Termitomyces sp. Mi166|nr:hypothetical protein C0995_004559 [Termitomyces sp. Mi166\
MPSLEEVADNPNCLTVVLKGHPSSRGTVKLTGSHLQDPLDIQKLHFQTPDGPAYVTAIREAIKRTRNFVQSTPIGLLVDTEIAPGPNVTTDEEIDNFIFNRVFGGYLFSVAAVSPLILNLRVTIHQLGNFG